MPKAVQQPVTGPRLSASNPLAASATPHPNVLKRNQACHQVGPVIRQQRCDTSGLEQCARQCRRRKLKWSVCYQICVCDDTNNSDISDAKRPCSTCARSHAHQVSHAAPGVTLPASPECTFDDPAELSTTVTEGPRNRYERLENRINELETLLRQKEDGDNAEYSTHTDAALSVASHAEHHSDRTALSLFSRSPDQNVAGLSPTTPEPTNNTFGLDLIWTNWPAGLPSPELLRHLVDVFFVFHPHANRLFHASSFVNSLSLPPTHPRFPSTPVLHAICAIGSLYTAAVTSPPLPNFNEVAPDEIFLEKYRVKEQRPDSFAEQQAKLARETAERLNSLGEDLFQVLQTNIILTWFYWSHGRWVDIFLSSAHSMRLSVPLGLNMCPPFHSITKSERPPSILPPARTVIEDETRRNAFWLAYAAERQHGSGNGWALSLDDQDISQLMPLRGDQFEQGTLVTPVDRQWAQSPDLLLAHPEKQIDSFILYIKGTILLSQVKAFNLRFRSKHFAGDPSVATMYTDGSQTSRESVDPRGSAAFVELDHIVSSFRASFPSHLRDPIIDNIVDNHLYTTCLMPLVATIVLHDPHAEVQQSGCLSALKILTAARAILDSIYNVWTTSYDITLLDTFCSFCWFVAGRVLVRFLQAAIDAGNKDQTKQLRADIDFVHSAIIKMGQRIPLAHRFAKILENHIVKHCGTTPSTPFELTFPRHEPHTLGALIEGSRTGTKVSLHEGLHEPGSFVSLA